MAKWLKRDDEWIKNNPGKPTMYKVNDVGDEVHADVKPVSLRLTKNDGPHPHAGIYAIICEPERAAYIGMSQDMNVRMRQHKMILSGKLQIPSRACRYDHMIEHKNKYGMEVFQFIKYKGMPNTSHDELLVAEGEAMVDFFKQGYSLYNISVSKNILITATHCPENIRPVISNLIEAIVNGQVSIESVNELTKASNE